MGEVDEGREEMDNFLFIAETIASAPPVLTNSNSLLHTSWVFPTCNLTVDPIGITLAAWE